MWKVEIRGPDTSPGPIIFIVSEVVYVYRQGVHFGRLIDLL